MLYAIMGLLTLSSFAAAGWSVGAFLFGGHRDDMKERTK